MTSLSDAALAHLRTLDPSPQAEGDRYEVLEELGRGGMGVVYRVHDRELDRDVAMKVVGTHPGADALQRLSREAQALARMEHSGIVPVHDVGTLTDGRVFYVMKLVRGERLDRRLATGMSLGDGLRAFARICDAVSFAHSRGVIHRDLKPQNVMLAAFGDVLVLDWGVAKVRRDARGAPPMEAAPPRARNEGEDTLDGAVLGTPGYMAPEQAAGDAAYADERADVFALGMILQDVVTAGNEGATPLALRSIIRRAASPTREGRYPSADALARDVAAWLDGQPVAAHRESLIERSLRLARRHRTALALIGVYLFVRLAILAFLRSGTP